MFMQTKLRIKKKWEVPCIYRAKMQDGKRVE